MKRSFPRKSPRPPSLYTVTNHLAPESPLTPPHREGSLPFSAPHISTENSLGGPSNDERERKRCPLILERVGKVSDCLSNFLPKRLREGLTNRLFPHPTPSPGSLYVTVERKMLEVHTERKMLKYIQRATRQQEKMPPLGNLERS